MSNGYKSGNVIVAQRFLGNPAKLGLRAKFKAIDGAVFAGHRR